MSYEDLKKMLMIKIEQDLFNYKQNLIKNKSPQEIVSCAYQINIREQIVDILREFIFSKEQLQALLKTNNLLDKLYNNYELSDGNIWGDLEENLSIKIGNLAKEFRKNREKVR